MLQSVFKDLYDQGILIFLNTDNYVTNNIDVDDIEIFSNRDKFMKLYNDKIELGWIFCHTLNLNEVIRTLKEDTCYLLEFGFNSDTEKKALEVGYSLVNSLTKFKFMTHWDERSLREHRISIVITTEDLPKTVQELVDEYELE